MSETQDNSETPFGRLIREVKEEAFHARRKLRRKQPHPDGQTKYEVAAALADYYDVLSDYGDEQTLDTPLDERIPVNLTKLLEETVTVANPVPSRNRKAQHTQTRPAVVKLSASQLHEIGKELDAAAKELGFAAPVADSVHRTKIDDELMEEVEEWRQQNLA